MENGKDLIGSVKQTVTKEANSFFYNTLFQKFENK